MLASLLSWARGVYPIEPVGPLETYDYADLHLIRTVPGQGGAACFVTSEGKAVWARRGDYVGKRFGSIVKIGRSGVTISEQVETASGEWMRNLYQFPLDSQTPKTAQALCSHLPRGLRSDKRRRRAPASTQEDSMN